MSRRCFVISPIGPEGSEIRQHADDVFDFIIKPAMDECGIAADRSDHIQAPGKITDQMFRRLMSDLCIAVVTNRHNPNVYYELAIAQAAAQPVIVLVEKGTELPFDIEHLRCIEYDLRPGPLIAGEYKERIKGHVREFERCDWRVEPPFGAATALSMEASGSRDLRFFETAAAYESVEQWARSVEKTERRFALVHALPLGWKHTDEIRTLYLSKASAGCEIRFLILHPGNPAFASHFTAGVSQTTLAAAHAELETIAAFFAALARESPKIEFRQLRSGTMHSEITLLDEAAMYVPFMNVEQPSFRPLWEVRRGHPLYRLLEREVELIWTAGEPAETSA